MRDRFGRSSDQGRSSTRPLTDESWTEQEGGCRAINQKNKKQTEEEGREMSSARGNPDSQPARAGER